MLIENVHLHVHTCGIYYKWIDEMTNLCRFTHFVIGYKTYNQQENTYISSGTVIFDFSS